MAQVHRRGRAQSQEYVAWLKKIRQIEDAALVTDISVEREMQDLQTFCRRMPGCKKLVLLDDAKRKAYKIAVNLKQALRDLERYPPEPSRMPEADGTVFYQAYLHARKQGSRTPWTSSTRTTRTSTKRRRWTPSSRGGLTEGRRHTLFYKKMDRFREAESGFLAARTAWRKCTERGRAQKEEHEAWFKKKQELVDAAFVSDIRVQSQMEELKTFTQEGFGRQTNHGAAARFRVTASRTFGYGIAHFGYGISAIFRRNILIYNNFGIFNFFLDY